MTQGRDGISLAQRGVLRCPAIARQLSIVTLLVSVVALVVGTAGISSARDPVTEDTIVVSNFGALFAGSVETFSFGSFHNAHPIRKIIGSQTLLGDANGAAGVAQSSSAAEEIAVAITAGLPAPPFVQVGGVPVACPADCHINPVNGACSPRTQFDCVTTTSPGTVVTFTKGANGNSAPATVIDGGLAEILNNTVGGLAAPVLLNVTGLFAPQGVAYNNPFANRDSGTGPIAEGPDILAVANLAPVIVGSLSDLILCTGTAPLGPPTIGTITEYNFGDTGNIAPIPRADNFTSDNTVFKVSVPPSTANPPNPPSDLPAPYFGNTSIGGCNTFLYLPVGLAFDARNDLWVVNTGVHFPVPGAPDAVIPPFVTEFDPDAAFEGDPSPINFIGLFGPTAGAFFGSTPLFVATGADPSFNTEDQFVFVTDAGSPPFACNGGDHVGSVCNNFQDNKTCASPGGTSGSCRPPSFIPPSIHIFDVSGGEGVVQTGIISGGKTHLSHPTGIALSGDDLYVASQTSNQLLMFDDFPTSGGNIRPKVRISGPQTGLNFPVGVALPEFAN